eukprot:1156454-Pelagomonas_calceolata.AAC.5
MMRGRAQVCRAGVSRAQECELKHKSRGHGSSVERCTLVCVETQLRGRPEHDQCAEGVRHCCQCSMAVQCTQWANTLDVLFNTLHRHPPYVRT